MPMPTLDRRLLIAVAATAMFASGLAAAASAKTAADKAYASVDPFIGTGGEGHTYPGATVPFGMVQLSPDTRISRERRPTAGRRAIAMTTAASSASRTRIFPAPAIQTWATSC